MRLKYSPIGLVESVEMSRNIVMLGPPGSGKGTQSTRLAERLGLEHISAGALLRAEVERSSQLSERIRPYLAEGTLVPRPLLMQVIEKAVTSLPSDQGIVFDGIPRSVEQADSLDELLAHHNRSLSAVIVLHVPDDIVRERLLARGRPDDTPEVITERLRVYQTKIAPILERYSRQNAVHTIDGTGTREEVFTRILNALHADDM